MLVEITDVAFLQHIRSLVTEGALFIKKLRHIILQSCLDSLTQNAHANNALWLAKVTQKYPLRN